MQLKIILASNSPRRAEVLRDAGIPFEICATQVDETAQQDESARAMVARLAEAKARAAAEQIGASKGGSIVIGADTAVELDSEIFGKPRDAAHAQEMLTALGGRTHHVLTGIFLIRLPEGSTRAAVESTAVTFAPLGRSETSQAGNPWIRPAHTPFKELRAGTFPKSKGVTSTWWGCRWPDSARCFATSAG
jgi:septum formation protein